MKLPRYCNSHGGSNLAEYAGGFRANADGASAAAAAAIRTSEYWSAVGLLGKADCSADGSDIGHGSKEKWDRTDRYKVVENINGEKNSWQEFGGKMKGIIKTAALNVLVILEKPKKNHSRTLLPTTIVS